MHSFLLCLCLLFVLLIIFSHANIKDVEYNALVKLFNSTGGSEWENTWDINDKDYCYYYGVFCSEWDQNITSISLSDNGLVGTIPPEICQLVSLSYFDLSQNELVSTVPDCVGDLVNLQTFYLYTNYLIGSMPQSMQNLVNLQVIDFSYNQFSGTFPNDIVSHWTFINSLTVGVDNTYGTIDERICGLEYLALFETSESKMSGTLPECFSNLTSMQILWLGHCEFEGYLPDLSQMTQLMDIDFSGNNFIGEFPTLSENLPTLFFNLNANLLNGTLPEVLCTFASLQTLTLTNNFFTGTLPSCVGNLNSLISMKLSSNNFYGELPEEIGNLVNLRYLLLASNGFTGLLPSTFDNLRSLLWLDLSSNPFNVTILDLCYPLLGLSELLYLNIRNTSIVGDLAYQLFWNDSLVEGYVFPNVIKLDMSDNYLTGTFPRIVDWWDEIVELDVSSNFFNGEIPPQFSAFLTVNFQSNPNLVSPDFQLPDFLVPDFNDMATNLTGHFKCPSTWEPGFTNEFYIDPSYYGFTLCECEGNYYGANGTCNLCLANAFCPGNSELVVNPGYYPTPSISDPQLLIPCTSVGQHFTPCNPNGGSPYQCATGHTGRKCSECLPGFFNYGGKCVICQGSNDVLSAFILFILIFALVYLVFRQRVTVLSNSYQFQSTPSLNTVALTKKEK